MRVTITIDCDNAAFSDGALASELKRILARVALDLEDWEGADAMYLADEDWPLIDINGNTVGSLEVSK